MSDGEIPTDTDAIDADAQRITAQLESIRQALRRAALAEARGYPIPLTAPQLKALQVLVDQLRTTGAGLSLTELSRRMALAHSTVAGIVTRLADRGILRRTTRPDDRRYVSIEFTDPVKQWLEHDLAAYRGRPLTAALRSATASQRETILDGLSILQGLLTDPSQSIDR